MQCEHAGSSLSCWVFSMPGLFLYHFSTRSAFLSVSLLTYHQKVPPNQIKTNFFMYFYGFMRSTKTEGPCYFSWPALIEHGFHGCLISSPHCIRSRETESQFWTFWLKRDFHKPFYQPKNKDEISLGKTDCQWFDFHFPAASFYSKIFKGLLQSVTDLHTFLPFNLV